MNQREWDEIVFNSEVPYPQRLLYCYLRRNADYRTGVVGDKGKKRISYQGIREALEYSRSKGSRTVPETYSRQRIQKHMDALERRGVVVPLESESAAPGRRPTMRKYLPLAVGGVVRPQEVVAHVVADVVASETTENTELLRSPDEFASQVGAEVGTEVVATSVLTLSLNNKYIYFEPDDSDLAWLRFQFGADVLDRMGAHKIKLDIETELFNLRNRTRLEYDMRSQREDWRGWIVRALQFKGLV